MSENSDNMLKALEANLPPAEPTTKPTDDEVTAKEIGDDYQFARKTYRDLVDQSNRAIETMMALAVNSEHPRAFEVLSVMLKNTSEIADKMMELQKKKKEVIHGPKGGPSLIPPGSTNVFIGSTAELQKQLVKQVIEQNEADATRLVE